MSDEKKPKRNVKEMLVKARAGISRTATAPFRLALQLVSRLLRLIIWNPITIGALMFILGARMHEIGYLAGHFGKDLRGATVTLSGACMVGGENRLPALAEDEVKITYMDGEKIQGVVRKTRELVECSLKDVAIDKLPLLANLGKSPTAIPELTPAEKSMLAEPLWKQLSKKTLVMSGSCVDMQDKTLPSFTDEQVDVTSVKGVINEEGKEDRENFVLTGIKKADRQAIRCMSSAIKYEEFKPVMKDGVVVANPGREEVPSMIGEMMLVTGSCFPDPRALDKKSKNYAFYKLANTRVQVLEEERGAKNKLQRIVVSIQDGEFLGNAAICDQAKFPFIYKLFNEENMKLENSKVQSADPAEEAKKQ